MARASCDGAKPPVPQTTPIVNNEIEIAGKWLLATGLYRLRLLGTLLPMSEPNKKKTDIEETV